jgi:hypothetical protein
MTEHHHDHGGHGGHGGGHEIDTPPTRELFNIVWGLGLLTLLSLITCVQLFNDQAKDIASERGKSGSDLLADYRKDMETRTRGAGEDTITDASGKIVARYNYIPLASARDLILAKPEKLGAFAPPPGWIHPDDVASGGAKAPAPAPAPTPEPVPAGPGGEAPTGAAVPAGDTPAPGTPPAALPPGTKDEAMPVNADKGQSESAKPTPGGTPVPPEAATPPAQPAEQKGAPAPAPAH